MNNENSRTQPTHWSFWLIAIVMVVWHMPAIAEVISHFRFAPESADGDVFREVLERRPRWATIAFAVFAVAGVLGGLLLLLRKRVAIYSFALSLVGVVVHMVGLFGMTDVPAPMKAGCVMSLVGAVLFIWYSRYATQKHWLR